jgi:hypothetical protein
VIRVDQENQELYRISAPLRDVELPSWAVRLDYKGGWESTTYVYLFRKVLYYTT